MKPQAGAIALCGLGTYGLITVDEPQEVVYADGNKSAAYIGVHLTDKIAPIGSRWSSRHPVIIAETIGGLIEERDDLQDELDAAESYVETDIDEPTSTDDECEGAC